MKSLFTALFLFLFLSTEALAFCTWGFVPAEREYEPLDATEVFISYENGMQTLVLQPEWQGNAKDFAIVYPTPSKPEVVEGPANIFWELNEATNPFVNKGVLFDDVMDMAAVSTESAGESVTVIEEKQVGEYEVTVLTATDANDLVEWLGDHDYNYTEKDADKVEYYVEQGDFYFVALKVDADHFVPKPMPLFLEDDFGAEALSTSLPAPGDWFWGELSPIQISFSTDKPQLPMRTLKSDMPRMTFDVYTLSEKALYVSGVDTVWSNIVDAEFLSDVPSLIDYSPKAKWLVRQEVTFDPSQSTEDLYFNQVDTNNFTTVTAGTQVRFDPSKLDPNTGIISGTRGQVIHTDGQGVSITFSRSLTLGTVGADVKALQEILNNEGFAVSSVGAGSSGNETEYFGERTKQALIKYQNFYRADILSPVGLSFGTGYFGPSTIGFINR